MISRTNHINGGKSVPVYINDIAAFLPNEPVGNEEIEDVLGKIHDNRSRIKSMVLKNNGIRKTLLRD